MTNIAVAQMTRSELQEMLETIVEATVEQKLLEILGDLDEWEEVQPAIRDRLLRQRQLIAAGQRGQSFEEVVQRLHLGSD